MALEFLDKDVLPMVNRLSIEKGLSLDVSRAMIAQAALLVTLATEAKKNNEREKLDVIIGTFLGSWQLLAKALNIPDVRMEHILQFIMGDLLQFTKTTQSQRR